MRTRSSSISLHARVRRGEVRANGIAVLLGIVVVGIATGAGFYRYKRGELDARVAAEMAQAPTSPAERLALWLRFSGPQIHHRLAVVGRYSSTKAWLVTHALERGDGAPPELWGIDCNALPKDLARLEDMHVVVDLPAPRALGRAPLEGESSERVPLYAPGAALDAQELLSTLALFLLEGIPGALQRDVPGASLEIRVAPAAQ